MTWLLLEPLEDRCLLSADSWIGSVSQSWLDPNNWELGTVPGVTEGVDEADFGASGNPCTLNFGTATLNRLSIDANYGGTITLNFDLKLSAGTGVNASNMDSGTLSGTGTLDITGGIFNWDGGTLSNKKVIVDQIIGSPAATMNMTGSASRLTMGAPLDNFGTVYLTSTTDVTVNSAITNEEGANFTIQSGAGISGGGSINNAGNFTKASARTTSTIAVPFTNSGNLSIGGLGTLSFTSTASQSSGTTTIGGGMATTSAYVVSGGTLSGAGAGGAVRGNLTINGGTVYPGGNGGIGTLAISNNYKQTGGILNIDMDVTVNPPNDQLNVTNALQLSGGTLYINYLNTTNFPAPGQQFDVISYGSIQGDFASVTGMANNIAFIEVTPVTNPYKVQYGQKQGGAPTALFLSHANSMSLAPGVAAPPGSAAVTPGAGWAYANGLAAALDAALSEDEGLYPANLLAPASTDGMLLDPLAVDLLAGEGHLL
jgi:hypothetical protein